MVLGRLEVRSNIQDIQIIMNEVKSALKVLGYRIKNPKEEFMQYQSLRIVKDSYKWLLDFHINLDRTGNLVNVEITRIEFFSIDKFISDRTKKMNRGNQQRGFFGSIFRFWLVYVIISFVGSFLIGFLPDSGGPVSTFGYVLLGVLGAFLVFYFISSIFRSYQKKNEGEKAGILTEQLKGILKSINYEIVDTRIICWNCYKEIIPVDNKCPECKKDLIKV